MNGLLYVAVGKPYVNAAIMSAASFRRFHAEPITVVTDRADPVWRRAKAEFNIDVKVVEAGHPDNVHRRSRVLKTQMFKLSPYDRTIFIDADTLVMKPVDALWRAPDNEHMVAMPLSQSQPRVKDIANDKVKMTKLTYSRDYELTLKVAGPDAPHYCSSTVAWRTTKKLKDFSDLWLKEWSRFSSRDMMALARCVATTNLSVKVLARKFSHRHMMNKTTVIYTAQMRKLGKTHKKHKGLLNRVQRVLKG